eukprot:COSAG02_NODE_10837_length_1848_cov_1.768439_1_plen_103_part_10
MPRIAAVTRRPSALVGRGATGDRRALNVRRQQSATESAIRPPCNTARSVTLGVRGCMAALDTLAGDSSRDVRAVYHVEQTARARRTESRRAAHSSLVGRGACS